MIREINTGKGYYFSNLSLCLLGAFPPSLSLYVILTVCHSLVGCVIKVNINEFVVDLIL